MMLRRTRSGDDISTNVVMQAVENFALSDGPQLKRHLRRLLGEVKADDAYQETFAKVINAAPVEAVKAGVLNRYIWRSALRVADRITIQEKRQYLVAEPGESEYASASETHARAPSVAAETQELLERAAEAIKALPELKRRAYLLATVGEMKISAVADQLGLDYNNAYYHVGDACKVVSDYVYGSCRDESCREHAALLHASTARGVEAAKLRRLKLHLSHCGPCRARRRQLLELKHAVAGLIPLPAVVGLVRQSWVSALKQSGISKSARSGLSALASKAGLATLATSSLIKGSVATLAASAVIAGGLNGQSLEYLNPADAAVASAPVGTGFTSSSLSGEWHRFRSTLNRTKRLHQRHSRLRRRPRVIARKLEEVKAAAEVAQLGNRRTSQVSSSSNRSGVKTKDRRPSVTARSRGSRLTKGSATRQPRAARLPARPN